MISVVCWKWKTPGYRSEFGPVAVNTMARMIGRHYDAPHRIVCVTNDAAGIDPGVEIVPDREDWASVPSPHGSGNPKCYRRLRLFAPDAAETFGERMVSIDLDCVIISDLRPLFDRGEDFVGWRDPLNAPQICASMYMLRAGSHPEVWQQFDPQTSPAKSLAAGKKGSDQGWMSYCLPDPPMWSQVDGVYSYRRDCKGGLPAGARIVFLHGKEDPWSPGPQSVEWVKENYR